MQGIYLAFTFDGDRIETMPSNEIVYRVERIGEKLYRGPRLLLKTTDSLFAFRWPQRVASASARAWSTAWFAESVQPDEDETGDAERPTEPDEAQHGRGIDRQTFAPDRCDGRSDAALLGGGDGHRG